MLCAVLIWLNMTTCPHFLFIATGSLRRYANYVPKRVPHVRGARGIQGMIRGQAEPLGLARDTHDTRARLGSPAALVSRQPLVSRKPRSAHGKRFRSAPVHSGCLHTGHMPPAPAPARGKSSLARSGIQWSNGHLRSLSLTERRSHGEHV